MAVYKVIQDIESEDKLIGPLTLKGFIYAAIAGLLIFIDVRLVLSGVPMVAKALFMVLTLPPIILFGTLASPLGREQPTEVWLLSHIIFLFKPRVRKWDQSGIKQLVKVTAPKRPERVLTKNFSQMEVESRLQALTNMLDSRGWAIKNAAINYGTQPVLQQAQANNERLADATTLGQDEPVLDVHPADDILDEQNNPTAQNVQAAMDEAEERRRQELQEKMEAARAAASSPAEPVAARQPAPEQLTSEEQALLDRVHHQQAVLSAHPKIIKSGTLAVPGQTGKLELAESGNDFSVATIASLVNRKAASQGS